MESQTSQQGAPVLNEAMTDTSNGEQALDLLAQAAAMVRGKEENSVLIENKSKKLTTATESRQSQPNVGLFDYPEHQRFPDGDVCFSIISFCVKLKTI